jgi:hypothetical protein
VPREEWYDLELVVNLHHSMKLVCPSPNPLTLGLLVKRSRNVLIALFLLRTAEVLRNFDVSLLLFLS